jgi:protein O-GlcNAc transferase
VNSSVDEKFRIALAALQARRVTEAERLFKQLLSVEPKHVPSLNLLCILLMTFGRFEEAESYAQRALNEDATSDVTFYNYGLILKALKRPKEALERFNQALVINPTVAESWNNRGTVFNDLRRYREAIADFDKAISIDSKYADVIITREGR